MGVICACWLPADLYAEHDGWSTCGSNGRAVDRVGPSVEAVLLGHGAGGVQRLNTALLFADHSPHGGGRRAVWPRRHHDQRTDSVSSALNWLLHNSCFLSCNSFLVKSSTYSLCDCVPVNYTIHWPGCSPSLDLFRDVSPKFCSSFYFRITVSKINRF